MQTFSLPVIVKPHDDGCSVMVYKITQPEELAPAIDHMFTHHKDQAMIEEFITGMELTVGVMGNAKAQALPPSQAIATGSILSIEEKFLPGAGENQTPAPLPPHTLEMIQQVMEKIYMALECKGYARIDCFYQAASQSPTGQERIIIIEVNTLPGLTPATCIFHQAAEIGLRPADFIDRIVQLGLEEHTRERPEQPQHHEHVEVRDESVAQ
jgi:D-alanine-D-alanine ligase